MCVRSRRAGWAWVLEMKLGALDGDGGAPVVLVFRIWNFPHVVYDVRLGAGKGPGP